MRDNPIQLIPTVYRHLLSITRVLASPLNHSVMPRDTGVGAAHHSCTVDNNDIDSTNIFHVTMTELIHLF